VTLLGADVERGFIDFAREWETASVTRNEP
jgi:hypothetical protein